MVVRRRCLSCGCCDRHSVCGRQRTHHPIHRPIHSYHLSFRSLALDSAVHPLCSPHCIIIMQTPGGHGFGDSNNNNSGSNSNGAGNHNHQQPHHSSLQPQHMHRRSPFALNSQPPVTSTSHSLPPSSSSSMSPMSSSLLVPSSMANGNQIHRLSTPSPSGGPSMTHNHHHFSPHGQNNHILMHQQQQQQKQQQLSQQQMQRMQQHHQHQQLVMQQHNPQQAATTSPASSSDHPFCFNCKKLITDRHLLRALEQYWHEDCLKCSCCDCRLGEVGSTLFQKANMILCKRDYLRMFGTTGTCSACNKPIPAFEMVMRARNNNYHLECFACEVCQQRFCVGDKFFLSLDNRVLCERDMNFKKTAK